MLKRILKMYPPIYQIVKLLYVNFKSKKYSKYNIENDLDHNENLLSNLELNAEFIKSTLNKNGLNYHGFHYTQKFHMYYIIRM